MDFQKDIQSHDNVCKLNWLFWVSSWCEFWSIDSLENNGTTYLLIFQDSREENCSLKKLFRLAAAEENCTWSSCFVKRSCFYQKNLCRVVESKITRCFPEFSPWYVEISTLKMQLILDSELNTWHRNKSFVPYGQLLFDFLPLTEDRQPRCMNSCSIASECYFGEWMTHSI